MSFSIQKGDTFSVIIESISHDGRGVAHKNGLTLFVQGGIPQDEVQVRVTQSKKRYAFAEILSFTKVSPLSAVDPDHDAAKSGTAPLFRLRYAAQLQEKTEIIHNAFSRLGKLDTTVIRFLPIISMDTPDRYRNKARYACGIAADMQFCIGSYQQHSHSIRPEFESPVYPAENAAITKAVYEWANKNDKNRKQAAAFRELIIRTNTKGQHLIVLQGDGSGKNCPNFINCSGFVSFLTDWYAGISGIVQYNVKNGTQRVLFGNGFLTEVIFGFTFTIPATAFFQVNYTQTKKLYAAILEHARLTGVEEVWDIYCGIGTISVCLAQYARFVRGNEISAESVEAAKCNAAQNNITNVFFETGAAETVLKKWQDEYPAPHLVVLDPPRSGCAAAVLEVVCRAAPETIIYVSCNPATLARDSAILHTLYRITTVQPVDMFPHTAHLECIAVLHRRENRM